MQNWIASASQLRRPSNLVIEIAAFAAIYLIWGSTYLAIYFAIESFPPFMMLGVRFGLAGVLMYVVLRFRGEATPSREEVRSLAILGGLMLFAGTGSIAWAENHIPTGLAALLVATVPLWIVLLEWLWLKERRPSTAVLFALAAGLTGVFLVANPEASTTGSSLYIVAIVVSLCGSLFWSIGSLLGKKLKTPSNPFMAAAIQMSAGGLILILFGIAVGETNSEMWSGPTLKSVLAVLYLFVFGSIVAFTAFVWLITNVKPTRVSTYAFVNPVVAVLLGTMLAGEVLTPRLGFAAVLLVVSVMTIVRASGNSSTDRDRRLRTAIGLRRDELRMTQFSDDRNSILRRRKAERDQGDRSKTL